MTLEVRVAFDQSLRNLEKTIQRSETTCTRSQVNELNDMYFNMVDLYKRLTGRKYK